MMEPDGLAGRPILRPMRRLLTLIATISAACATVPAGADKDRREIVFDPIEIKVDPSDPLLRMNDQELFAGGVAAYAAGEFVLAARHFERVAEHFPASEHRRSAFYNAGLALAKSGDFRGAGNRFQEVMKEFPEHKDALDAHFRLAECHYQLGELAEAETHLAQLIAGPLTDDQRAEATVKLGVVQFEAENLEESEKTLKSALRKFQAMEGEQQVDEYYRSQAQFFLGEIFNAHFSKVHLDPAQNDEAKLAEELEFKCQLLLSSQGHYLRTIRLGDPEWGTAAGYKIGSLYEGLYDELTTAPTPEGFDADQIRLYRRELQRKVKILVEKSIGIYERTLAAAERTQATNPFVAETQKSLDRMKSLLTQEEDREATDHQEDDAISEPPVGDGAAGSGGDRITFVR